MVEDISAITRTVAREHAEQFVDYLRESAAHTPTLRLGDHLGVMREVAYLLDRDGFDPRPDGDDERVSVFVSPQFLSGLKADADAMLRRTDDGPGTRVQGMAVYADATLDGDVIAIHNDAIVPDRHGHPWKPYHVREPRGVVAATVEKDE